MSHKRVPTEGYSCGSGAAERPHYWRESGWEESPAAKALRTENERLRAEAAGHRATAEQAQDLLSKATDDLLRMSAEVGVLRAEIVRANNALYDVGPDISDAEHTIERHTDTVPAAYLRLAKGASEAWGILAAVVVDMVEPKEST